MMPPQRVCFPFLGRTFGGSHVATLILIENLPAHFQPLIVVHEMGPLTDQLDHRGIPYRILPLPQVRGSDRQRWSLLWQILLATPRLLQFLKHHKIRIVHANDGRMNVLWAPAARLRGLRMIWHQHSRYVPSNFANLFVRLANHVIGISRFSVEKAPAHVIAKATILANPFVFEGGAKSADAKRDLREEIGAAEDTVLIGYFGNFMERKRPMVFLEILHAIRQIAPDIAFMGLMFGDAREPFRSQVSARRDELMLTGVVHLMGFRSPPEPLIAACDLLIAPAINEPFGRTLVEAMLMGTPVIAAQSGGHCEIIVNGKTGVLIPPDDVSEFAAAAVQVLRDERAKREMVERALAESAVRFSLDAYMHGVVRIYNMVLDGRSDDSPTSV